MRVLFDQGTPVPLREHLSNHNISTALELGWSTLTNGDLLDRAEAAGFEALVTTDQNLKYQQNLSARRISIVVICTTSWPRIKMIVRAITKALDLAAPGSYLEIRDP